MSPLSDKSVSPVVLTPAVADAPNMTVDDNAMVMPGRIQQAILCPYQRSKLVVELNPMFYDSTTGTLYNAPSARRNYGLDFFQANATKRPVFTVDANGRPYLAFDGNDDFMATTDSGINSGTIYCAFKWNRDVARSDYEGILHSGDNIITFAANTANIYIPSPSRVNGVATSSLVPSGKNIISGTIKPTTHTILNLCSYAGSSRFSYSNIYCLLMYSNIHTLAETQQIEAWLDDTATAFGVIT